MAIEAQASGLPVVVSEYIPKEARITEAVTTVSLSMDSAVWAEAVLETKVIERENGIAVVKSAGFDIQDCTKKILEEWMK